MKIIFIILVVLLIPCLSFAAETITFDGNGKWNTTFDCSEVNQDSAINCDGLNWYGAWTPPSYPDSKSQITSAANNPLGSGNGERTWFEDGVANNSAAVSVVFSSSQTELWVRYYVRYELGFAWDTLGFDKHLYFFTDGSSLFQYWGWYGNGKYAATAQVVAVPFPVQTAEGQGWDNVMSGVTSDGAFHCIEVYCKMDTDQTDGVGRVWINGILKAENTSVDYSNGDADAKLGWTFFQFNANCYDPDNGDVAYVDYDDIVVYNTTPPNTDASGNPYIGPISTVATTGSKSTGSLSPGASLH